MKLPISLLILASVFALVAVIGGVGFMLPPGVTSTAEIHIGRPAAEVWQFLYDHSNVTKWMPEFTKVEILPHNRWKASGRSGGTVLFEDTDIVPPRRLVSKMIESDNSTGGLWEMDVRPDAAGCVVSVRATLILHGAYQRFFAHFFFNGDKEEHRTLELLKRTTESGPIPSPQSH
jgi:uncharacterized protein YndB with AHSA1/START domain